MATWHPSDTNCDLQACLGMEHAVPVSHDVTCVNTHEITACKANGTHINQELQHRILHPASAVSDKWVVESWLNCEMS